MLIWKSLSDSSYNQILFNFKSQFLVLTDILNTKVFFWSIKIYSVELLMDT